LAKPRTTIVIPNYNGARHLAGLLPSIAAQSRQPARVVIVDNHSNDDSRAISSGLAEWVSLDRNYGFAYAVNRGVELANTEYTAILNNDTVLDPNWLAEMEQVLDDPACSYASPLLLSAQAPDCIDGAWDLLSRSGCPHRALCGEPASHLEANREREIQFAPMTASLFRTSLWRELGGLDEGYGNYLEDVDFCLRAALAGHRGRYVPSATALHFGSATLGNWSARSTYWNARNQLLLIARHYPPAVLRDWWLPVVTGQILYLLLAARHAHPLAAIRGKAEILLSWRTWRSGLSPNPATSQALKEILEQSECEIASLTCAGETRSLFWRLYFRLNRFPEASPC
jgi:GT2 family glycosyltransferase